MPYTVQRRLQYLPDSLGFDIAFCLVAQGSA
jgi:hypothetical protein